ncbi:Roundabout -like protein 1 [Sarcoptes scabiei]|uniref:Roundabout -like protein 1 n=1 Tax=Sarcoptes scabiei TaxID=52283 RepID=A0A834VBV3_SARSC|nr:Roundabout -like protein 1 [Sarcoptes scabiei]
MNHKKEKDTGIYYCLARNVHGKARSHNATIEIASIRDEFRVLPKNVLVAVGDVAILECSPPRGYPEPRIQWRKDDELIVSMNGRYQLSGSNLHINDVRPEDAGRYQCIAQNLGGSRESPPAQLIVRGNFCVCALHYHPHYETDFVFILVKPYFITKPEDVTALSNKMAEIHCKVGGDPLPKVTWRREGGQISSQRHVLAMIIIAFYSIISNAIISIVSH